MFQRSLLALAALLFTAAVLPAQDTPEGPDIKAGVLLPTFENIDVFSLITRLLDLKTPPVDGAIGPLESVLKSSGDQQSQ
jgi:hypothetical protein